MKCVAEPNNSQGDSREDSDSSYLKCPTCGCQLNEACDASLRPFCKYCAPATWLQVRAPLLNAATRNNHSVHSLRPVVSFTRGLSRTSVMKEARRTTGPYHLGIGIFRVADSLSCFESDFIHSNFDIAPDTGARLSRIHQAQMAMFRDKLPTKDWTEFHSHFGPIFLNFTVPQDYAEVWERVLLAHLHDPYGLRYVGRVPVASPVIQLPSDTIH